MSGVSASVRPLLSVVLPTDSLPTIARTLRHLRRQTIAARIELLIVTVATAEIDGSDPELAGFGEVRVVRVDSLAPLPTARAAGTLAAAADLVAFAETHTYHGPGWAQALVAAHEGSWVVVGPAVFNANPRYAISWANLMLDYGPWIEPERSAEIDVLPGHNSCYRRELLLGYGERLGEMLQLEHLLHNDIRAGGGRLWIESAAKVGHLNVSGWGSWLPERFSAGRFFAACRAADWSWPRRLLYACASPLIPVVRALRLIGVWGRVRSGAPWRTLPVLIPALLASALGEAAGYLLGKGGSPKRLNEIELHRELHLRRGDVPVALAAASLSRAAAAQ